MCAAARLNSAVVSRCISSVIGCSQSAASAVSWHGGGCVADDIVDLLAILMTSSWLT